MAEKIYKNYAVKKQAQKNHTYVGNSPFFSNIPEFQWLKPLHRDSYPHLREMGKLFRLPSGPRQTQNIENETYN